jgi:hypothetical protein
VGHHDGTFAVLTLGVSPGLSITGSSSVAPHTGPVTVCMVRPRDEDWGTKLHNFGSISACDRGAVAAHATAAHGRSELLTHRNGVTAIAVSAEPGIVASGCRDGEIRICPLASHGQAGLSDVARAIQVGEPVTCLALLPQARHSPPTVPSGDIEQSGALVHPLARTLAAGSPHGLISVFQADFVPSLGAAPATALLSATHKLRLDATPGTETQAFPASVLAVSGYQNAILAVLANGDCCLVQAGDMAEV